MTEQEKFDVDRFLNIINKQHQEPRKYRATDDAIETLKEIKNEFDGIDVLWLMIYDNKMIKQIGRKMQNLGRHPPRFP